MNPTAQKQRRNQVDELANATSTVVEGIVERVVAHDKTIADLKKEVAELRTSCTDLALLIVEERNKTVEKMNFHQEMNDADFLSVQERVVALELVRTRPFLGRMRWLFRGR